MRIAFLSYEFPDETGGGGIGTYLKQCHDELTRQNIDFMVFCGTTQNKAWYQSEHVYRIPSRGWRDFDEKAVPFVIEEHRKRPFTVAEGCDYMGCGLSLKQQIPDLPLVVKLHTPLYLIDCLQYKPLSLQAKIRFIAGSLRRFRWNALPKGPNPTAYKEEFDILTLADSIHAPSRSIADKLFDIGMMMPEQEAEVFPLLYNLDKFFGLREKQPSEKTVVTFIGRKEIRKGVVELANAIRQIAHRVPFTEFRFYGGAAEAPDGGNMDQWLQKHLGKFQNVKIYGRVSTGEIPEVFGGSDILVFPSHYESFGLVCAEAMASGKAIIGSKFGGMAEMLDKDSGLLIDPFQTEKLAAALIKLIAEPELRQKLGAAAREKARWYFSKENTVSRQLAAYKQLSEQPVQ